MHELGCAAPSRGAAIAPKESPRRAFETKSSGGPGLLHVTDLGIVIETERHGAMLSPRWPQIRSITAAGRRKMLLVWDSPDKARWKHEFSTKQEAAIILHEIQQANLAWSKAGDPQSGFAAAAAQRGLAAPGDAACAKGPAEKARAF